MFDLLLQVKEMVLSKTAKDTSVVFLGNSASFVFGIVFTIVAARQIDPSGWGIFSAVVGFVGILLSIGDFGLTSGLFRFVSSFWNKGEKRHANKIVSAIFTVRLVTAAFLSLFVIAFSKFISQYFFKVTSSAFAIVASLGLFLFLLNDFQISIFQAKSKWKIASAFSFSNNLLRLIFILIFSKFWAVNLLILLIIFFISPFLTLLVSFIYEHPVISFDKEFRNHLKRISSFSFWMGVNRTAGAISSRVDSLLLLQLTTASQAGIVGIARQLSNAVLILLSSFATVIAPRFSTYKGIHLKNYFKKTLLLSFLIAFGIFAFLPFADSVISVLGPKYIGSSSVFKWLLVALIPFALSGPSVNALIYSFNKPKIVAVLSLVQLPLIVLGNFYAIPRWGIFGPVIVLGFWNLSTLMVSHLYSLRYLSKEKGFLN